MSDTSPSDSTSTSKPKGLLHSGLIFSFMTLVSRVMGLVRDVVIAIGFGSSATADAFFVAFKIPNFLRRLFAEGAFSQAFVPVLSEYESKGNRAGVKALVDHVFTRLSLVTGVTTVIGVVAAPWIVMIFAPGFASEPEKLALAGDLLRITFPYLFFITLTAFAGSILNTYHQFGGPAFTPVLLNLSLILCALFLAPLLDNPVFALAWGVFIAGALQLVFQLPFLARIAMMPKPVKGHHPGVKKILVLMVPALFGVSVGQINLLLDTVLASFLVHGSVSWLYYSDRLMELPLGIFGVGLATVILPSLSKRHAEASADEFKKTLSWALEMVLLIGVPALVALFVLAEPLLTVIFQYGAMSPSDVEQAAKSLRAYSFGLLAFMLIKVLASGYYARQDTKTPVKIGIVAMVANMAFNLMLVWHLAHAGLALATSLSAFVNAGLLYWGLHKTGVFTFERRSWNLLAKVGISVFVMALGIGFLAPEASAWIEMALLERVAWMAGVIVLGAGSYGVCLIGLGLRPYHLKPPRQ